MRKEKPKKRIIAPDTRFNDIVIAKLINSVMEQGKKEQARKIVYNAIDIITEKTQKNGYEIIKEALERISPSVEVKRKRVKGANIQVPVEARPARKSYLSRFWLIEGAKKRSEKSMEAKLAMEAIAASQGEGNAIKKRSEMHKMAEANKAFAYLK